MPAGADLRVPFDVLLDAFAVDATVIREPGADPIETSVIWLPPQPSEMPIGMEFTREDPRKVLALPTADVPTVLTMKTIVEAPEVTGGTIKAWRVEGIEREEVDHTRVRVREVELPT